MTATVPLYSHIDSSSRARPSNIRRYKNAATALFRQANSLVSGRDTYSVDELRNFNSLLPVGYLPREVLCRIFIACTRYPSDNISWAWINVSYVCSSWRLAALGCQELWRHIDFSHSKRTEITLKRSQMMSLSIRATVNNDNIKLLHHTLLIAHSINEIDLVAPIHHIVPLMGTLSYLRTTLKSIVINAVESHEQSSAHFKCPTFSTDGPPLHTLTYLELHRVPFSFVSTRYVSLTHMSLHNTPFSEQPTHPQFYSVIEELTLLEHLAVDHAFPASDLSNSAHIVHLPHLISLVLCGSVDQSSDMLNSLILPANIRLSCSISSVDHTHNTTPYFKRLGKAIGRHFQGSAETIPLRTMMITSEEESFRFIEEYKVNPEFRQSMRICAFRGDSRFQAAALDLIIGPDSSTSDDEVVIAWFSEIWKALPLSQIDTLAMQNADIITQKSWVGLLPSLKSLRVLDISGHPPSGLIWALLLNTNTPLRDVKDEKSMVLHLQDIYLHDLDCFAGGLMVSSDGSRNSYRDLDDSRFLEVLLVYFERRHYHKLGLRSLCLSRCSNVVPQVLDNFRKQASHVLWDNRGRRVCEAEESGSEDLATYRRTWLSERPPPRHYNRLRTFQGRKK